jgi:hypothetical protein
LTSNSAKYGIPAPDYFKALQKKHTRITKTLRRQREELAEKKKK